MSPALIYIDYRSSAYALCAAGKELSASRVTLKAAEEFARNSGLDAVQTDILITAYRNERDERRTAERASS